MEDQILIHNVAGVDDLKSIIKSAVREELELVQLRPDQFLTRKELARKLRVSLVSLDKAIRDGRIKGFRLNGRILFKENDIKLEEIKFKGKHDE